MVSLAAFALLKTGIINSHFFIRMVNFFTEAEYSYRFSKNKAEIFLAHSYLFFISKMRKRSEQSRSELGEARAYGSFKKSADYGFLRPASQNGSSNS